MAITVVHELAHHFGIDDERLHELGWAEPERGSGATGNRICPRGSQQCVGERCQNRCMSATCRECGADVEHEHCHGTVIVHIGQRPECTEADCTTPEDVHGYTIDSLLP